MIGQAPDMVGFVGTAKIDTIVGGFFAVQYRAELIDYDVREAPIKARDAFL